MGLENRGSGLQASGFESGAWGVGFGGLEFKLGAWSLGLGAWGLEFEVWGLGCGAGLHVSKEVSTSILCSARFSELMVVVVWIRPVDGRASK